MTRLCPFNGEEDYSVSRITGRRTPEFGLNGGVIPEHRALRMQYRELLDEVTTRTGCGGEGYARGAEHCSAPVTPRHVPTRSEIIRELQSQRLASDCEFYVRRLIGEVARAIGGSNPVLVNMYDGAVRAQFPEFWGWGGKHWRKSPPSLWGDVSA